MYNEKYQKRIQDKHIRKISKTQNIIQDKKTVKDPYLDELKSEYDGFSNQIKKLKKKLLKTNSIKDQEKIINEIDLIAKRMERNQKQSVKVTKTRLKKPKTRR